MSTNLFTAETERLRENVRNHSSHLLFFDKWYKRTEIIKTYLSHKEYEILRKHFIICF